MTDVADASTATGATGLPGPASLRLAVVGPSHAHQEAAAAHSTMLAHHLAQAGHEVTLVAWARPYPSRLRGARVSASSGTPEVPPFPRTIPALSWARPDTWVRAGARLRETDAIIVVHVDAAAVPAHLALLRSAGALRAAPQPRPQSIVMAHAPLPADSRPADARLMSWLLGQVDSALVHDMEQATRARGLGVARVSVCDLPPHVAAGQPVALGPRTGRTRLLALGHISEEHGIDLLLRAMRSVPDVRLTIAGEIWARDRELVAELASDAALAGRVDVREGHVQGDELVALLTEHDVLVLPYRTDPSPQDILLAHAHGLPVLASTLGPFVDQVEDGVNGLLVPPGDEPALVAALRRLDDPDVRRRLADGVKTPDVSGPWARYLGAIETLSVDEAAYAAYTSGEAPARTEPSPYAAPGPAARALSRVGEVAALARRAGRTATADLVRRRPVLDVGPADLPAWVRATDVLSEPDEADDARRLARVVGLGRVFDRVSAWAALGALAAILRVRDDGRRSAVVVDESGTRSVLSRWARAVGFAPVQIEFTGTQPSVAALDVDTGSLDVIVRIHPRGCDSSDIDHVLEQASWALRSGGLLIVTVPLGPPGAEGALGPADVRGVLARAHDLGFVLVGDLDGDVNARMRDAGARARADDAAYGLVRLTLRRR